MALVLVMYERNQYWPEKAPQHKASVSDAVCCHDTMPWPCFMFALLLTFDEHVKCIESDQEMTEPMSKPLQGISAFDKMDDFQVMKWIVTFSPV